MTLEVVTETKLTVPDRCRFAELEDTIEKRIQAFYEIGEALNEIRNRKLFRDEFPSFGEYCQHRWGFAKQYAYRLIAAHKTLENVDATEEQKAGLRETHLRPLAILEPDEQKKAFNQAIETAPGGQLTEKHVQSIVNHGSPTETAHTVRMKATRGPVEWYTPAHVVDFAADVFGNEINLDPASCEAANKIVDADHFFDIEANGLAKPWFGKVWINPPYDNVGPWVEKMIAEYENGNIDSAILLVNANTETVWFSKLWKYSLCFLRGRLKFWNPAKQTATGAPHGNAAIYLGPDPSRFAAVFCQLGPVFALKSVGPTNQNRLLHSHQPAVTQ